MIIKICNNNFSASNLMETLDDYNIQTVALLVLYGVRIVNKVEIGGPSEDFFPIVSSR